MKTIFEAVLATKIKQIGAYTIHCSLILILMVSPFLRPTSVYAFRPTINGFWKYGGFSPTDHTHESITRVAVAAIDREFFPEVPINASMREAINDIVGGNARTDLKHQIFGAKYHFDSENIEEGRLLITTELIDEIKTALANKNTDDARTKLGRALHALQDFYSHSNWVDMMGATPNAQIIQKAPLTNLAGPEEATCINCVPNFSDCLLCDENLIPTSKITSGYFGLTSFSVKPAGKCSHGGGDDTTSPFPPFGGINKDTSSCEHSPRHFLHDSAGIAAVLSTKQFLRVLKEQITAKELRLLLGVNKTLAFAIDTTGSMGSVIAGVRQSAIQIVDSKIGTDDEPTKYVLVPFSDPSVGPLIETQDPIAFKNALSSLTAGGGGDCPELAMTGAIRALSAMDEGGDLYVITDATAKDASLYFNVNSAAIAKKINVYFDLFGSCSPIDPAYINIARNSGGQLFFLERSEAASITKLANFLIAPNAVDILSVADSSPGTKTYSVPVDSTMNKITFSVSGGSSISVMRPDGSIVKATDPNTTFVGLSNGGIFSISNPVAGNWSVSANTSEIFSVKATGDSNLDINSFDFVESGGKAGHEGYFPISGLPELGRPSLVDVTMSDDVTAAEFEFRTKAGEFIQSLPISRGAGLSSKEFFGEVSLPNIPFQLYVKGLDRNSLPFQRVISTTFKTQTVKVVAPDAEDLQRGVSKSFTFQVKNLGPSETFDLTATDDKGFLTNISDTRFTLSTDEVKQVTFRLLAPSTAQPGIANTLTVSVRGVTSGTENFAIVTNTVTGSGNRPPDVSQAQPTRNVLWPADHSLVPVSIKNVTDPDGDPVTISIDKIMQDEATNLFEFGDACPDQVNLSAGFGFFGSIPGLPFLRAERSSTGDGRVYTVSFTASDGKGGSSAGSVKVFVPIDLSTNAIDGGALFNSAECP